MPKVKQLREIQSIKVGPDSTVLPDGTIVNPVPYKAVNVSFDDGITVQVERPLTVAKVRAAYQSVQAAQGKTVDKIAVDMDIPV